MCGQMRQFLDATGKLWVSNARWVGKVGSVMSSSNTQHGGQEATILSFHITLLHQGMVIVGLPYSFQGQMRIPTKLPAAARTAPRLSPVARVSGCRATMNWRAPVSRVPMWQGLH